LCDRPLIDTRTLLRHCHGLVAIKHPWTPSHGLIYSHHRNNLLRR